MGRIWILICVFVFVVKSTKGGRYKSCSEDCCRHEFCAYDEICYPSSRCRYGCPDGECVGTGDEKKCVPYEKCTTWYDCGPGTTCTMHYNLGYRTCQYNLEIGSTLCDDRRRKRVYIEDVTSEDSGVWTRLVRVLKRGLDVEESRDIVK